MLRGLSCGSIFIMLVVRGIWGSIESQWRVELVFCLLSLLGGVSSPSSSSLIHVCHFLGVIHSADYCQSLRASIRKGRKMPLLLGGGWIQSIHYHVKPTYVQMCSHYVRSMTEMQTSLFYLQRHPCSLTTTPIGISGSLSKRFDFLDGCWTKNRGYSTPQNEWFSLFHGKPLWTNG